MENTSSKQQTKQKYKPNHQHTGLQLTQPCPSGETNKQVSTNLTLYEAYTNHWTNLRRAETKRKNSTLKRGKWRPQTPEVKKKIMKRPRNTTQMKEQIRNTEVQINEEEGKRQTT